MSQECKYKMHLSEKSSFYFYSIFIFKFNRLPFVGQTLYIRKWKYKAVMIICLWPRQKIWPLRIQIVTGEYTLLVRLANGITSARENAIGCYMKKVKDLHNL